MTTPAILANQNGIYRVISWDPEERQWKSIAENVTWSQGQAMRAGYPWRAVVRMDWTSPNADPFWRR
jgi:hypothetical protein